MARDTASSSETKRLQLLAKFRHRLRVFLRFSETAADRAGLKPQQHQLLLQIAGAPAGVAATIAYAAERLILRHNTVVELVSRCEGAGLIVRRQSGDDRRCVHLELTGKGRKMLAGLSADHARELNEQAPLLMRALIALRASQKSEKRVRRSGDES